MGNPVLQIHQYAFFNADLSYDMIRQSFYTILKKAVLSLYIHPHTLIIYQQMKLSL